MEMIQAQKIARKLVLDDLFILFLANIGKHLFYQ